MNATAIQFGIWLRQYLGFSPASVKCILFLILTVPAAGASAAEANAEAETIAVDVGFATAVPVHLGGQVQVDLPYQFLLRFELGWMPPAYVDVINEGAQAFDAYGDQTAELIRDGIQNSLIMRASVGGRPFSNRNIEVSGGYTVATLGGSAAAVEVVEAVFERELDSAALENIGAVDLESTVHALHIDVGYRWELDVHWLVRASLGYVHVVSSDTTALVTTNETARREAETVQSPELEAYLDNLYTTYVRAPVLTVSVAYRF
ncbi:MAG: hypothetical protein AAFZ38_01655 [Myxococcota bacterium]